MFFRQIKTGGLSHRTSPAQRGETYLRQPSLSAMRRMMSERLSA